MDIHINELFNEYLSDLDAGELLAKANDYDNSYSELSKIKQKIVDLQNSEFLDVNRYYDNINKIIPSFKQQ